ncbi:hypothetical protein B0H14DRAFT_3169463 [Mycena olivaceomarginata]|nr:hypothetical protein B0H14DRAFT_3169463 [Mycena olivaceomarginata]
MADVLELETDGVFDPSPWIAVGRIYKDVPIERCVPNASQSQGDISQPGSPSEFLALNLSGFVADLKKMPGQTDGWFSFDVPNCDLTAGLWAANSIPPTPSFADSRTTAPKNGSTVPSQFSTHPIKLYGCPCLHCLSIGKFTSFKKHKTNGFAVENGFGIISRDSTSQYSLRSRGIRCSPTRLMGSWIGPAFSTMNVAPLAFQHAIIAFSMQEWPSRYTRSLLKNYKDLVDIGKQTLYFPLHVGGNHWIAFFIDFKRKAFGYEEEEEEEDEEDYEEPEGTSSKKHKSKPPRGASKKQKEAAAEKQKVQRKKKKRRQEEIGP